MKTFSSQNVEPSLFEKTYLRTHPVGIKSLALKVTKNLKLISEKSFR